MKASNKKNIISRRGSALALVVVAIIILTALGVGLLNVAWGVRHRALVVRNEAAALLAAEAGYEKAIFWMNQQPDVLSALQYGSETGGESFAASRYNYNISFYSFLGSRPVYKIACQGYAGTASRTLEIYVLEAIGGWEMGMCRVPTGPSSTTPVNYADGEIMDMPIHINRYGAADDSSRDIHIIGSPQFLERVSMGESRYSAGGTDKYDSVMDTFEGGIYFDQPDSKITDNTSLQTKVDNFRATLQEQKPNLIFTPAKNNNVSNAQAAVQLEFYVGNDGKGYVRITNNCTMRGYKREGSSGNTYDYMIDPAGDGSSYEKYFIYGYHYIPENAEASGQRYSRTIESTKVTPSYGGVEGRPGGQIFVDGNVIIGSSEENAALGTLNTLQGDITVAATGNIWITESISVSDNDNGGQSYARQPNGVPGLDNPNILGLVAQGVIKIADPGMSDYSYVDDEPPVLADLVYEPISHVDSGEPPQSHKRHLPDPLVVEASLTIGGGGWGAENVRRDSYGGRKEDSGNQDVMILRGTLTEAIRAVIGLVGADGYIKQYYMDMRVLRGIVPGNMSLKGKFIPTPAGWHDYRTDNQEE